jgi:asparagine synthase (glutamine-hydrolysing)
MASEIKQFSTLPGWAPRANAQRSFEFLNWGWLDHTEQTLFEGVRQLRGGESIHCSLEELSAGLPIKRWYELKPRAFQGDAQTAAEEFQSLFTDSVRLRLRADVAVGSCLSGGLDSSSIVCVANRLLRAAGVESQQSTFSACAKEKRYDEREYIDLVVADTGVRAHYVYPALEALFDTLGAMTWHQDEPFGSTSPYAQWHVFKLAAGAQVKVLLDGQGADELLGGYHSFFAAHFAGLLVGGHFATLVHEARAAKRLHGLGAVGLSGYLANALLPEGLRQPLRRLGGKASSTASWFDKRRFTIDDRDPALAHGHKTTSVNEMSRALLLDSSIPKLLHWADRNSMAHSVESRLPFLDFRLAEFVLGLPPEIKLSGATTKRVLRDAMRGELPERVRMRMDKMAFATPEQKWIRQDAPERFQLELRKAVDASHGMLNDAALSQLDAVVAGKAPFDFLVWRMISFGAWMSRFGVQAPA